MHLLIAICEFNLKLFASIVTSRISRILSLTTGIEALHILSWRVREREERRQARKTVWPVNAGRVICRYRNHLYGITNHHKDFWDSFWKSKSQV